MDKNVDLILADVNAAKSSARALREQRRGVLALLARIEDDMERMEKDLANIQKEEGQAHIKVLEEHGSTILTDPELSPVAESIFTYIYDAERFAVDTPVSDALRDAAKDFAPVEVSVGVQRGALYATVYVHDLKEAIPYTKSLDFITMLYENYRAHVVQDATLTINIYEMYKGRRLGPLRCVVENVDGGWVSYRHGTGGRGNPTADRKNLRNTIENILSKGA